MKKLIIYLTFALFSVLLMAPRASAVNITPGCTYGTVATTPVCSAINKQTTSKTNPILKLLKTIIGILGLIIGIGSVIVIIIAGLTFVTDGSNPQSVTRARNMILYALAGVFFAVLAESIVVYVLKTV